MLSFVRNLKERKGERRSERKRRRKERENVKNRREEGGSRERLTGSARSRGGVTET